MSNPTGDKPAIRPCRLDEAALLLDLWQQARATVSRTDTVADIEQALAHSHAHVLVAEVAGRLVGSVIGSFDGWRGNIHRLMVHPDYRRQGIAQALVSEIERLLAGQGARRIGTLVEKEHSWAVGFWQAAGYNLNTHLVRFIRNL